MNVLADLEAGLLRTEEEMGTMQLAVKRMFLWEASKSRRLPPLPAVLAAVCLTLALALGATPARAEVKTGAIGKGCSYTLDDSGKLTIYPTDGVSGEMADPDSAVNYSGASGQWSSRGVSRRPRTPVAFSGAWS